MTSEASDKLGPMRERTPADFSREFAGYMATAADAYCKAVNVYHRQIIDAGQDLPPSDDLTDAYTSVFAAIYEWRKREDRAALTASEADGWVMVDAIALARLQAVYRAARGLCHGEDWNNGTHAKTYGYRMSLIDAVHDVEPLPSVQAKERAMIEAQQEKP